MQRRASIVRGADERAGRAAVQASGAAAAGGADRRVGLELGRREDRADEDPRARRRVGEQVRVLADPAEPRPRRQRAFGQRPVVDVGDLAGRQPARAQVGGQPLEPAAQGVVVVGADRVARDPAGRLRRARREDGGQVRGAARRARDPRRLAPRRRTARPRRAPSVPPGRGGAVRSPPTGAIATHPPAHAAHATPAFDARRSIAVAVARAAGRPTSTADAASSPCGRTLGRGRSTPAAVCTTRSLHPMHR